MPRYRAQVPEEESELLEAIDKLAQFHISNGRKANIGIRKRHWILLNRLVGRMKEHAVFDRNMHIRNLNPVAKTYCGLNLVCIEHGQINPNAEFKNARDRDSKAVGTASQRSIRGET